MSRQVVSINLSITSDERLNVCGICGVVDFSGRRVDTDLLWGMVETLRHRGPDDSGIEVSGPIGLGHTRLSIIDLSSAGHQPMTSECGRYIIVYNGELYNFPELRQRLEEESVRFKSKCDTEVVLKCYMRWGMNCFAMFNGMFAIAIWDSKTRLLLLVRDRFGIKPLFYYRLPSGVVFGSEIKSLLASHYIRRDLNWEALHEYLYYGYVLGSNSFFDGIERLRPGHVLSVSKKGIQRSSYYSFYDVNEEDCDVEEVTHGVRERFSKAVSDHLISDVPVGVFLSGGIDSSAITAVAAKKYRGRLKTFSVGFDWVNGVNELPKARLIAEQFGTDHHEIQVKAQDAPRVIESLVRCHDEPFADSTNIPLYMLCEQLHGEIKVILQGDGGDEIFAGYRRYNVLAHEKFWRLVSRLRPFLEVLPFRGVKYHRIMRQLGTMAPSHPAMRMALLMTSETCDSTPTRILAKDAREQIECSDPFNEYTQIFSRLAELDPVQRMLYSDCMTILPNNFLEKVDRASMAHGIEVRVPFLDSNLTAYVLSIPASLKVRGMKKKWILRQALRGILPDTILDGRKTGFDVPFEYWLKEPLADYMKSIIISGAIKNSHLLDYGEVTKCMDEHISGRRDHGILLYRLLNLALWYEAYMV